MRSGEAPRKEGKASHYSGEMPLREQERHPGKKEKQVITVVQGSAPSHTFGGRTLPAIKLLTSVNKAGSCRHCEIRRGTPEERKSKSLQWCKEAPHTFGGKLHKEVPPRLRLGGRTLPAIKLLTSVNKAGSCRQH